MIKQLTYLLNFVGLALKISALPLILTLIDPTPGTNAGNVSVISGYSLIILGIMGIITADLHIFRFGDAKAHFSTASDRLVDIGFYAHNRHPFFLFLSLYHLGVLLLHYGLTINTSIIYFGLFLFCALYLLFIQEKQLARSLGKQYQIYKSNTPFWYWKWTIEKNQALKFLPLLVWVFGMIYFRIWYHIKVTGSKNIPHEKSFVVVANHESYIDPVLFGIFIPFEVQYVTTADVFTTPLTRFLLKGIGTFPMRRHRQDLTSIRTMIRMVNSGQTVGIFPEGGRSVDGSPIPILNETLKLIQRCRVPILPVHIDGAYEIWPRWAPNRRRGRFSATFQPIIPVEDQSDIDKLGSLIQKAIFSSPKTFRPVKSRFIANGLDKFLWACCECEARNTIEVTKKNEIKCRNCDSRWTVTNNYMLQNEVLSKSLTLIEWSGKANGTILNHALSPDASLELEAGEQLFLNSAIRTYEEEDKSEISDDLALSLTNKKFILSQKGQMLHTWSLNSVTMFTIDFAHAISIGVGGVRHRFLFPDSEITYKWQDYFITLTANQTT